MKDLGKQNKSKKQKAKTQPLKISKEQIINQAYKFHSQGNIQEAAKYYQYFIDQGFKNQRVFSNYGVILKSLGKLKEAELCQRRAIELNPKFGDAHSNLGTILKDLGKLKEAELCQRKAIELDPNLPEAHSNLGTILKDLGKLKEAELCHRKAIELNPNFALAHSSLGNVLKDLRKLKEAELVTRKAIELNPNFANAHVSLGNILKDLGKLQEAELVTRKAIELNPSFALAHSNLGNILKDLGKLHEAELSLRKAIEFNPDDGRAYYSLSTLKYSNDFYTNKTWQDKLFSESLTTHKSNKDKVDIYFARANILHTEKKYKESAKYLKLANQLKLKIKESKIDFLIQKSQALLLEVEKKDIQYKDNSNTPKSIFIVGMPRSGSTLIESILSMNTSVNDLGEINILEESFIEKNKFKKEQNLSELYWEKTNNKKSKGHITTNKCLYNYQYAGIISTQIPNAKIIHCYRNPLDNILSIFRAHFGDGHRYSSSLVDCAKVYIDQEKIMTEYKRRFRSKIYDLNYESLVTNPDQEIKNLIDWLGWKWNDSYLYPHLNPRSVSTASSVQVRSPINPNSLGGWKKYKEMLKPAIEIISQTNRYEDITYSDKKTKTS